MKDSDWLRMQIEIETEGELTPMQRRFPYVEVVALEYRLPVACSESPRPDAPCADVAPGRRPPAIALDPDETLPSDFAGLPGVELRRDAGRAQEQIPTLTRPQAG